MFHRILSFSLTGTSKGTTGDDCQESNLDEVNETISMEHEETMDSLFECTNDEDGQYIDLSLNPERYTGKVSVFISNIYFPFILTSICFRVCLSFVFVSPQATEVHHLTEFGSLFTKKTASSDIAIL